MKDALKNDRILSLLDLAQDIISLLAVALFVAGVAAVGSAFVPQALPM